MFGCPRVVALHALVAYLEDILQLLFRWQRGAGMVNVNLVAEALELRCPHVRQYPHGDTQRALSAMQFQSGTIRIVRLPGHSARIDAAWDTGRCAEVLLRALCFDSRAAT